MQSSQSRLVAQDCAVAAPNDESIVTFCTIRTSADFNGTARKAVEDAILSCGGSVLWRDDPAAGRSYALVEVPGEASAALLLEGLLPDAARLYAEPIVALAIFPAQIEAVPALLDALGGGGRPAGILACDACDGGVIVEWNPATTTADLVWNLVDVELRRWGSGRRAALLSPLPPDVTAAIAAAGLQAPEIGPDRVIETLLERAGLRS
jgi:hypothetical protein